MNGIHGCNNLEWCDVQHLNDKQWAGMNMNGGIDDEWGVLDGQLHATTNTVLEVDL